jgi:hypothetical protein
MQQQDKIRQEVADQLFSQVKDIVETGSNGEIQVYRNQDELEEAKKRIAEQVRRRIEADPLILELARLEIQYQIAVRKGVPGEVDEKYIAEAEAADAGLAAMLAEQGVAPLQIPVPAATAAPQAAEQPAAPAAETVPAQA